MCDNARRRIKIKIKKKEKTQEPVLQCADIFRARPTHLGRTPRKKTRKSAVYQLARTCTQERPRQSAKMIANAEDICSKKRANKITERLRTFQKCFLVKKENKQTIFATHERSSSHATNTISAWNFLMVESGKKIFSLIFQKHGAVNEFYGANDISFQMRGPIFPSSAV